MKRDIVENQGSATLFLTYQVFHEKQVFLNKKKMDLVCLKLCPKLFDHSK